MRQLDYYLIRQSAGGAPAGVLAEEFVLCDDYSTAGTDSAGWTPEDGRWWSSAAFSGGIRFDAELRDRVTPIDRDDAAAAFRLLGGGVLPDEPALRGYFHDRASAPAAQPLRLRAGEPPAGFREQRVYSIVCAKSLDLPGLEALWSAWRMEPVDDPSDPQARIVGRAEASIADHSFSWELRRLGPGVGWSVDVTADLGDSLDSAVGSLLAELRRSMHGQGLITIAVERFV